MKEPWELDRDRREAEEARREHRRLGNEKLAAEKRARRARRRFRQATRRERGPVTGPAVCPECGDADRLFAVQFITATRAGRARFETGVAHFEAGATTDVDWDSTETAGYGCGCGWRGRLEELALGRD